MNNQQENPTDKKQPQEVTAVLTYFGGVGKLRITDNDNNVIYEREEKAESLQEFTENTYKKIFKNLIEKRFLRFIPLEPEQIIQMKNGFTIRVGRFYDRQTYEPYTKEDINRIKSISGDNSGNFIDLYCALMFARGFDWE